MIPADINELITGRAVECNRIEYKSGWDPEPIMHSIVAFANDYEGLYGGYVLIGVEAENGIPILPIKGVGKEELDFLQQEILEYCKKYIVPSYVPRIEVFDFEGKSGIVIWAFPGYDAPYQTKEHLYAKDAKDYRVYVRKGSSTLKASPKEVDEIIAYSRFIPFDERPNREASVEDLSYSLILEFLRESNSSLMENARRKDLPQLAEALRIISGPKEDLRPTNAGILFFTEDPSDYIPYSYIEVDYIPDPTGEGMINKEFHGPVQRQLKDALQYIRNNFVATMTRKVDYQAEALVNVNYPFAAIEEILTNAILHKSYQIGEPINVRITKNEMMVTSFPGFDASITDRRIANFDLFSRRYRNRRIGDFLKDLHLAESKNTGVPKALDALKKNGSPNLRIEMDEGRNFVSVIIPIHPLFQAGGNIPKKTLKVSLRERTLDLLRLRTYSLTGLADDLGYQSIPNSLRQVLAKLIKEGLVVKEGKIYHIV